MKEGTKIGHYEILSPIAAGGMGEVYLARDTKLERQVAIKLLGEEFSKNDDRLHRFTQEARAASALNHPNILTIHEIGETGGRHYIATEYIEGETLRHHIEHSRMNIREVLDIVVQVAGALSTAHQAGIVHRDIKPENIMLRPDGIVKVLDFGLAKLTEMRIADCELRNKEAETLMQSPQANPQSAIRSPQSTDPGTIMGTVAYMSPEQARGKAVDARSDIFSLGVVLYEMIAGRAPFAGESSTDVLAAILGKDPQPLARFSPDVPQELQRIATKCLRKDRDERYQTMKDVLLDLRELREELALEAKLERSVRPTGNSAAESRQTLIADGEITKDLRAQATDAATAKNTSSAEYIVSELKQHKRGFAIASIILLAAAIALGYWLLGNRATNAKQIESIAVMPFVNESSNADMEYLSDGMTETLISSLSQLPNLNIKPRSIVFRYKGKDADPQTIGNELNVQAVLIGRVASRGADLSLFAELIDVVSTKVIWSQRYNRKQNEIVSLQSEIARDISSKLKIGITNEEQKKVTRNYTENPEAYRHYLRGSSLSSRRKSKDVRMSIEAYEQAIAVDSNYALAYSGLANAHLFMVIYGGAPPLEEFAKARAAALKALELDPALPAAHAIIGVIAFYQDRDFNAMERGTLHALELDPNQAGGHRQNGLRLSWLGRFDEAIVSYRRSLELEPLLLVTQVNYGWCLFYAGRIAESDAQLKVAQEIDPSFWFTEYQLSVNGRAKGDYAAAVGHLARAHELRDEPETAKSIRDAFAKGGWRGFIESALSGPEGSKLIAYYLATLAAEAGKKDKAFALLSEAYDRYDQFIFFMKIDPFMDPLRGDPRFEELLKKLGFPG